MSMIVEKSIPSFFDAIGGTIEKYPAYCQRNYANKNSLIRRIREHIAYVGRNSVAGG
jgi:hypothetical protein